MRSAIEKASADGMLKIGNGLRHGRLGKSKLRSGLGHAAKLHDVDQDLQVTQSDETAEAPVRVRGRSGH